MEYHVLYDPELEGFQIQLVGTFSHDKFEECYQSLFTLPRWKEGMCILWDVRECSLSGLTTKDVIAIGQMIQRYRQSRGRGNSAWLVATDLDYGLSRMFEMMHEDRIVTHFRVFRSIADARAWLEQGEEKES